MSPWSDLAEALSLLEHHPCDPLEDLDEVGVAEVDIDIDPRDELVAKPDHALDGRGVEAQRPAQLTTRLLLVGDFDPAVGVDVVVDFAAEHLPTAVEQQMDGLLVITVGPGDHARNIDVDLSLVASGAVPVGAPRSLAMCRHFSPQSVGVESIVDTIHNLFE